MSKLFITYDGIVYTEDHYRQGHMYFYYEVGMAYTKAYLTKTLDLRYFGDRPRTDLNLVRGRRIVTDFAFCPLWTYRHVDPVLKQMPVHEGEPLITKWPNIVKDHDNRSALSTILIVRNRSL